MQSLVFNTEKKKCIYKYVFIDFQESMCVMSDRLLTAIILINQSIFITKIIQVIGVYIVVY